MRRAAAVCAVLAVLIVTSSCSAAAPDAPTSRESSAGPGPLLVETRCADLVVLGLRGSDQSATRNHGVGQEVLASVKAMSARLHRDSDSTVRLVGVPYPAVSGPAYTPHVLTGVKQANALLTRLGKQCRHSQFGLVGFSQGAQVVHGLALELVPAQARRVAVIAMIADPRRNPDDHIARWSYGKATPEPGKLGAGTPIPARLRSKAISFCATGDEICNWPPGGYTGALSDTHRHFYETPAHSRSTGHHLAAILLRNGL